MHRTNPRSGFLAQGSWFMVDGARQFTTPKRIRGRLRHEGHGSGSTLNAKLSTLNVGRGGRGSHHEDTKNTKGEAGMRKCLSAQVPKREGKRRFDHRDMGIGAGTGKEFGASYRSYACLPRRSVLRDADGDRGRNSRQATPLLPTTWR